MSDKEEYYGMTKKEGDTREYEEIAKSITRAHPIELEDQIDTLASPLIIECACPGWQLRNWPPESAYPEEPPEQHEEGEVRYPAVPCTIEEQVDTLVEAIDAGCAATHVHPRDPEDCLATGWMDLLTEVYDGVFERTDAVSLQHSWARSTDGMEFIPPAKEHIEAGDGSNKYIQGALVLWPPGDRYSANYTEEAQEGTKWYLENDIKPIHKVRGSYDARRLQRDIVEPGLYDEDSRMVVIHDMGHPYGWPMDQEPWWPIEMISSLEQTKQRMPDDALIGVYTGNRNWLPVTMMAILAGVDIIRIGIEDAYWMYPHRDDVIQRNIDCIRKITDFCDSVGRELATPEQAREMMGIELT